MSEHVVIIGYTNIGRRVVEYLDSLKRSYVLIEKDMSKIENLIEQEKPVVADDPWDEQALKDASIEEAFLVFIAEDDLDVLLLTITRIRELVPRIHIIARVFEDDIAEVLEKTYNVKTISTSLFAANRIKEITKDIKITKALMVGWNHVSERLSKEWSQSGTDFRVMQEGKEEIPADIISTGKFLDGDPTDLEFLKKISVDQFDLVLILIDDPKRDILVVKRIRELNPHCVIITRTFSDSIGEVLTKTPFESRIISSSKETLDYLAEKETFELTHPFQWLLRRN